MSSRILLLVDRPGNRRLLAEELAPRYEVIAAESDQAVEEPFDLGVFDEAALARLSEAVRARKQRERPLHLPVVLLTTADTVRRISEDVQPAFDDVLLTPVERRVLRTRVQNLLVTRRLSKETLRRAEEAERASRLRDEVLAVVAHDLRNLLGTIAGSAELLHLPLPEEQHDRHIEIIHRTADRMSRLTEDLLDVAKIETGGLELKPGPVPTDALLAEACEAERVRAEEKALALDCDIPADLPSVRGDRDELLRVLSNLIGNATKFTAADGRVTVKAEPHDAQVRFSISDTGPGIPADELPLLFAPFWQADRTQRAGSGLGLAIAKGIVDAHGGAIWAESRVGVGSTFHFTVPVWDAA